MKKESKEEIQKNIQGFMRTLLTDPQLAILFLKSPKEVAKRFAIKISDKDAKKIKRALESLQAGKIPSTVADDCSWHDFPECDHIAYGISPSDEVIRPDAIKLKQPTKKIIAEDCSWHDFPECDHIAHALKPGAMVSTPARKKRK